ncbi:MAG TPA: glycosyltransferase [Caulobacteraceae bacterium]|jgi:glycosyltransferase involved in cell wall biosynthesis
MRDGLEEFEFGPSELERLLCNPSALGFIEQLAPRIDDAWSVVFPDLRALPPGKGEFKPLRICIATEDIVGPVRNGGIGTTYAALSELLAKIGHEVTILYLRGQDVETGDIDQWVRYYADRGVTFTPVPNYAVRDDIRTNADRWLRAPYNMLRYLIDHPMDVVHASEWRGSAYLSLLAKSQGLAFNDTLFVIKTSSPWMWNRLYGSQPLERLEDLAKVHAERLSVELADVVIGGSLHLLRWMSSQGYRIPRARTFVQPNVATFEALQDLMSQRSLTPGTRIPIDELVFFGRLEARKGLFIFCQAIKRLIRQGVPLPPRISFMGKPGAKLTARPTQTVIEYIEDETRDWPTEVQILTEFQQHDAIQYLLGGARLAVMPSVIENSSMAIYEAAICGIPSVATAVGGNAELVAPMDRTQVLCDPHPLSLGDKLREAIERGGYVPRPSFDNDENLETWRGFHQSLARGLREELLSQLRVAPKPAEAVSASVCIYHAGRKEALRASLESIAAQEAAPQEIFVAVDTDDGASAQDARDLAAELKMPVSVVETFDLDAGASFNAMARQASGDFLLLLWEGATLRPAALRALETVAQSSGAELLNYFYRVVEPGSEKPSYLKALVMGSSTDAFFRKDITALPLFVRRQTFIELGGFSSDYRVLCGDYEFAAKVQLAGRRCETILLELGDVPAWDEKWLSAKGYDIPVSHFRAIRPQLAAVPLGLRDMLLLSKGLQIRPGGMGRVGKPKENADAAVDQALSRMMHNFSQGPRPPAQPKAKGTAVNGQRPKPNGHRGAGMMTLIDAFENTPRAPSPPRVRRPPASRLGVNVVQEGTQIGQILAVYGGSIYGWALDLEDPAKHVRLVMSGDGLGEEIASVANIDLPLALETPDGVEGHGFRIPVRPAWLDRLPGRKLWSPVLGSKSPAKLTVRTAEGLVLTRDIALPGVGADLSSVGIQGFCDASDDGVVKGWARREPAMEDRLDLAIFVDQRFLTRVRADHYREDVHQHGHGDGEYGFGVTLPPTYRDGTRRRVDVVVADIGLPLARSPLWAEGRRLTHRPQNTR